MNRSSPTHRPARAPGWLPALLLSLLLGLAGPARSAPSPSLAAGRYVFERHCQTCHGPRGNGRGELAVGMLPPPRDFRRALFKYRSTPSGSLPTDADLARTIRSGVSGTAMPAFSMLAAREIEAVIEYLKSLSPRWTNPLLRSPPVPRPVRPAWFHEPAERARHADRGALLFARLCTPCHGVGGAGDGPSAAQLLDAWERPCPPRDLRTPHLHSGPEPEDLLRTLTTGLDGTPMPSFQESTTEDERWDLVAHLLALAPAP